MADLLSIAELVDTQKQDEGVWVRYKDTTFEVKVSYYGRQQMKSIIEKSKKTDIDSRTLKMTDSIDEERFSQLYAEKVIKDWRGLTAEVLRGMIVMKASVDIPEDFQIPCTQVNKTWLVKNSITFDAWVQAICSNVETFNVEKQAAEIKN